ncbi:uncharacterized protein [Diadema setosum]|uniref:uncharacterized protein n=1 Tax=Diadema setosum TaxID=31175 RepID=UPI003B3AAC29
MSWRIFIFSIFMGMTLFLVWTNYQETGSLSESVNKSLEDVTKSHTFTEMKKAWQKSSRQASLTVRKLKDGRLLQDAVKFIDKITMLLFRVKTTELETELQKYDKALLDCGLFIIWLLAGYLSCKFSSGGTALFTMATTLLVHALYGPAWCMYEFVCLLGLLGFIMSVIANNAVFSAFVLSGCYALYALWRFAGPSSGNRLDRIEARLQHVQHELVDLAKQLTLVEDKVDLVRAMKRESK